MNLTSDEDRLLQAAREYQTALEEGRPIDRGVFLARHGDVADLPGYLDTLDALHHVSPPPVDQATRALNEPLGDFRILREIGRGGMGVVYEAEQLSLGRRVALKVLSFAATFDARQLARFHNEAKAAALLHHTNIVPVFAVGCDRGVHYYAMQRIDGRTLGEVIASQRGIARSKSDSKPDAQARVETSLACASGLESSSSREQAEAVARLMAQAARALEHAHAHGIIHRDVKPANLMLDTHGQLWVADFGLAHLQSSVELTLTGDVVGTLRYMSPEQASGQNLPPDPRGDVYSLGATFYELLTLEPILPGPGRAELLRQIAFDDPRPPRAVRKCIPVELETILLKCLSKSPAERYPSAGELADDLERFLGHRPLLARRPTLLERTRKWSRRHPGVAITTAVLLALTTLGLLVNHALVAREQARTREALVRARQLVELLIQISDEELDDRPHTQGVRKRLLHGALGHYEKLIDESRDDPAATAELARARERVRQVVEDLATMQQGDQSMILSFEPVLDELRPSDPQRKQLRELMSRLRREGFDTILDTSLTAAEKRKRQLDQARDSKQSLAKLLSPRQQLRLRQVALQMKGVVVFRDPDVVAALELTPGQRQRLREIEGEVFGPVPIPPGSGRRPPGPHSPEILERCLALLTSKQVAKWRELTGPVFDASPMVRPGRLLFAPPPPRH